MQTSEQVEVIHLNPHIIRMDGGTQPRSRIDPELVRQYRDALKNKAVFPPIVVFYDGEHYWLADGFHRVTVFRKQRRTKIPAEVHQGTRRDAILYSVGANAQHGRQRSHSDTRRAAMTLLTDPEWATWSDREIARRCRLSHTTVAKYRAELAKNGELPIPDEILDGQVAVQNVKQAPSEDTQGADSKQEVRKFITRHGGVAQRKIAKNAQSNAAKNAQKSTLEPSVAAMIRDFARLIEEGPGVTVPPELAREISRLTGSAILDEHGDLQVHAAPAIDHLVDHPYRVDSIGPRRRASVAGIDRKSDRALLVTNAWLALERALEDVAQARKAFRAEDLAAAVPLREREAVRKELTASAAFLLATLQAFSATYRPASEIDPEHEPSSAAVFGHSQITPTDDVVRDTAERQHKLASGEFPACKGKRHKNDK